MVDIVLTLINVILTIISGVGAYKSLKYFRKSHNLTVSDEIKVPIQI